MRTGDGVLPVSSANIVIRDRSGKILIELKTDGSGNTEAVSFYAPDKENTLKPDHPGHFYSTYDVEVSHENFITNEIHGVQIFDTISSALPVNMLPVPKTFEKSHLVHSISIPEHGLLSEEIRRQEGSIIAPIVLKDVAIPDYIFVIDLKIGN